MPIVGAAVDSRRVEPGNAFFALPGERTDGHRFLEAAVAAGAAALVVSEPLDADRLQALAGERASLSVVHVADPAAALRAVAAAYRARFDPLVIGITGSLAKTSTKELVAEVLAGRFRVLRSVGNENNEIGLPLTLLRLRPEHEVAVLEMGLYTMGEIALLARLAQPSIGVVTAVRGVHLSRAGSIEAIEAGKRELVEALPASGWAVLNADDPRVSGMARLDAGAGHPLRLRRGRRRARRGRPLAGCRRHALPAALAGGHLRGDDAGPGAPRRPQRAGRRGRGHLRRPVRRGHRQRPGPPGARSTPLAARPRRRVDHPR